MAVGTHCPRLQNKMFEADENLSYLDLILMHCIKLQICTIKIIINKPSKWMIVAQILSLYGCNEWPKHPSFWNGWRSAPDSWPLVLFFNRVQNMDHGPYSRALCTWHLCASSLLVPLLGIPNPHTLCKAFFCITTPELLSLPNPQPPYMILVHPLHTGFPPSQHLATCMALCYPLKESVTRDRTHDWLRQWHEVRLPPKALGASEGWRERAGRVMMEGTRVKTRKAVCSGEMVFLC